MRHLLLAPVFCATLAACAAPGAPRPAASVTLAPGQSAEVAPGVTLTFEAAEDSRCPPGMRCVRAGTLVYRFSIRQGEAAPDTFTLAPGQPAASPAHLGGRRIVLDETAIPAPAAPGAAIAWRATIRIVPPSTSPTTP